MLRSTRWLAHNLVHIFCEKLRKQWKSAAQAPKNSPNLLKKAAFKSLPYFCAMEERSNKSRYLHRTFALAHNLVHSLCAEPPALPAPLFHHSCPIFRHENYFL